jgi:serine/threonine protein kinase, bacterial
MPLSVGDEFAGYRIVRLLGSGGMGEVYLVEHPRLPKRNALKILSAAVSGDASFRERFTREADLAATLWHEHIVGVHDRGEHDGQLWITMDFVDGADAAQSLATKYPAGMAARDVAEIVTAVASALDYAHKQGLLHRDVKPANIMLAAPDDDGRRRILLADFGIARPVDDISGLTATNMTVGTVAYSAPEQLMGEQLDGRADQYALAATAYHLLAGAPLFPQTNPAVVISRHLNALPPNISASVPALSALDPVLAAALAKDPNDRFARCADFAHAFTEAIQTSTHPTPSALTTPAPVSGSKARTANPPAAQPARSQPPAGKPPAPKPAARERRTRAIAAAAAVSAVLVAAIGTAVVLSQRNDNPPPRGVTTAPTTTALSAVTSTPSASAPGTTTTEPTQQQAVLGESRTTSVGVRATPFTLENPTTREPDPDFARFEDPRPWAVVDAELCAGAEPIAKTGYGFTLVDAENREHKAYDSTLQPFEPTINGGNLAPGECARGYVNFELPRPTCSRSMSSTDVRLSTVTSWGSPLICNRTTVEV